MKKAIYIIITIFILGMLGAYLFAIGSFDDIQKPIVQTQQEYCVNTDDRQQECIFQYRENFICGYEDKTKNKGIMVISWKDQGEKLELNLLSSNINRCIYARNFKEYTPLESGEYTYKANLGMIDNLGEQGFFEYMLKNCTDFEKEEGLCEFYSNSFLKYAESLKEKEENVSENLEI
jgi:uncharacterized protein YxeA